MWLHLPRCIRVLVDGIRVHLSFHPWMGLVWEAWWEMGYTRNGYGGGTRNATFTLARKQWQLILSSRTSSSSPDASSPSCFLYGGLITTSSKAIPAWDIYNSSWPYVPSYCSSINLYAFKIMYKLFLLFYISLGIFACVSHICNCWGKRDKFGMAEGGMLLLFFSFAFYGAYTSVDF